jgi:hypothetical protein
MAKYNRPWEDRLWEKVNKIEDDNSCWEWTGSTDTNGYGHITIKGKKVRTSRLAWEFFEGTMPAGMHVLHTCDNRRCVRRKHLFLGTHQDNMKDRNNKGRQARCGGELCGKSKLTWEQVYYIRKSTLSLSKIAKELSVSKGTISHVRRKTTWWPEPSDRGLS